MCVFKHSWGKMFLWMAGGLFLFAGAVTAQESKLNPLTNPTPDEVRATFLKGPDRNFATAPLWVWNDLLTETQIRDTLGDLASQDVKQAFVHPRPGLMTPYLSADWFRLWRVALDEAEKLDMNIWIYDENSYPSGFGGGLVPDEMPESRGKGLHCGVFATIADESGKWNAGDDVMYVVQMNEDGTLVDRTAEVLAARDAGEKIPALTEGGKTWFLGRYHFAGHSQWYGGKFYVDLLKPGVTEKFMEVTHERYKKELGEYFGTRIPGLFTDEPQITPAGGLSWTDDLPQRFQEKFGYSLIAHLPLLSQEADNPATGVTWRQVRHDYHALLLELFITRWAAPCFAFCEKNNLEFTGHYWEHGWSGTSHGPDNMAMYAWHQRPAIDLLMNGFNDRHVGAQFGNIRAVKELASVANQMGRSRTLSENYGAGGWDLTFEDMKRLGDWSYVLGVNTMDEHLSYITIRGARKHDHPQSFSYHASWWEQYHLMARYFTRLSYMLSQGKQVNRVLILEPTTTGWMYQNNPEGKRGQLEGTFTDLVYELEARQVEYDLGSEDIIARQGQAGTKWLKVGRAFYELVVLPPVTENLGRATLALLAKSGVQVQALGDVPQYVDGVAVEKTDAETQADFDRVFGKTAVNATVARPARTRLVSVEDFLAEMDASFWRVKGAGGKLYHHCRAINGGEILFLCNASLEEASGGSLKMLPWRSFQAYDAVTGKVSARMAVPEVIPFAIPPAGSLLYVFSQEAAEIAAEKTLEMLKPREEAQVVAGKGFPQMRRLKENVLVLDYLDVETRGKSRANEYFYRANQFLWNQNGFGVSPWDNGVQLRDDLLKHEFSDDSAYSATYRFTLAEAVPDLRFVIERGDLYEVTCNGQVITPIPGAWYLDKAFPVYDIRAAVKVGVNEVRIACKKMHMWAELMPAYVIGDFSLENAEAGFAIKKSQPLYFSQAAQDAAQPAKAVNAGEDEKPARHSAELEGVAWLTTGVDFADGKRDLAPWIEFTLEEPVKPAGLRVWNYCEAGLEKRGVKTADIYFDDAKDASLRMTFRRGNGEAETLLFTGAKNAAVPETVTRVRMKIRDNYNGVWYPLPNDFTGSTAPQNDNAFVGLAEVRFLVADADGKLKEVPVKGVKASSELTARNHDRRAIYAVNGAGFGDLAGNAGALAWQNQGMPFYADTVAYTQTFRVKDASAGVWKVRLPEMRRGWWGSVAKVAVNGKEAGCVAWAPCEADVTGLLADGENEVTVTLYGTPKNLYGPHHVGRHRGSAWPGSFHQAPAELPEGTWYDMIPTGIFEPFVLVQEK